MLRRCFINTIETTVQQQAGDTFVITGDILAMWLRVSTAQVLHYLRFADDLQVAELLHMLMATHAGTGFIHESFDPDAPEKFTRSWFVRVNSIFAKCCIVRTKKIT